ncbi:hypothetical protein B0T25DRAFT_109856 [Lasiosphaeria hispida]|uniref:Uncharacterized protein n=1 Tax=Lasiosphaeria hispida TaxID=260671 RepID=A0AAJ0MHZ5_9PEZI|nr:hypothetical protein B0T25DRAFT_109856 [Lasiosphaeria hispida]
MTPYQVLRSSPLAFLLSSLPHFRPILPYPRVQDPVRLRLLACGLADGSVLETAELRTAWMTVPVPPRFHTEHNLYITSPLPPTPPSGRPHPLRINNIISDITPHANTHPLGIPTGGQWSFRIIVLAHARQAVFIVAFISTSARRSRHHHA